MRRCIPVQRIDLVDRTPAQRQGLISQLVVPRPIAMITTDGPAGFNVAPFSYYMPVCGEPPTIAVTIGTVREASAAPKDTWVNMAATGEFVVNATTTALAEHIELVAREYPPGIDEAALVGWRRCRSDVVAVDALADSPAHLECRVADVIDRGDPSSCFSGVHIVLAEVVNIRVADDLLGPDGRHINPARVDPIGRMGFPYFVAATGDALFQQERVPYADLPEAERAASGLVSRQGADLGGCL
jgi:flavin reductase (DIM6/NTAB) family NADH-FMN oxidoreductase RutF